MTEEAFIKLNGSGEISTYVTHTINSNLSGSGTINIFGNPKNKTNYKVGSGNIIHEWN